LLPAGRQDIAAEFWAGRGRERKQRLINVDGFAVLRENNYTLTEVRREGRPRSALVCTGHCCGVRAGCGVHAGCERAPGAEPYLMMCLVCQCDDCVGERRLHTFVVCAVLESCQSQASQAQGEPSVYGRETARPVDGGYKKKGRQVAGKDYVHSDLCQARPVPARAGSEAGSACVPSACHGLLRAPLFSRPHPSRSVLKLTACSYGHLHKPARQ